MAEVASRAALRVLNPLATPDAGVDFPISLPFQTFLASGRDQHDLEWYRNTGTHLWISST